MFEYIWTIIHKQYIYRAWQTRVNINKTKSHWQICKERDQNWLKYCNNFLWRKSTWNWNNKCTNSRKSHSLKGNRLSSQTSSTIPGKRPSRHNTFSHHLLRIYAVSFYQLDQHPFHLQWRMTRIIFFSTFSFIYFDVRFPLFPPISDVKNLLLLVFCSSILFWTWVAL